MKTTVIRDIVGLLIVLIFSTFLNMAPQRVHAQDIETLSPSEKYTTQEITQMLAPIALYPDALLSQILMASTYPIEVIEANRWVKVNSELVGDRLDTSLLNKDWDPSVKAICHFPSTLAVMSDRINETTNLGNAFLAQETEVLGVIQHLRDQAYSQGNLRSTTEQTVIVEKETIIIQPARPEVIYIPYYDPYYVYGPWWYPGYRPYYWGPSGVRLGVGVSFWPGVSFGFVFGGWSHFDWHRHHIQINSHKRPRFVRNNWYRSSGRWQHAPRHRRGVAYRDKYTARKYGQTRYRSTDLRHESRGYRGDRPRVQQQNRIEQNRRRVNQTPITRSSQQHQQRVRETRQQQRNERIQQQNRIEQNRRRVNQAPNTRTRQEQQQHVRETRQQKRIREMSQQHQRVRQSIPQQQQRVLGTRQQQQQRVRDARKQQRSERIQQQSRTEQNRRRVNQTPRTRSDQQQQQRVRDSRQQQQPRTTKESVQRQQADSIFTRSGDGNVERRSSKRGKSSRHENIRRQREQQ